MSTATQSALESTFGTVRLAQLHESKTNPRRHFSGLEELTGSVKQHGVLTPLLVRPLDNEGSDLPRFEIVAGARRYRAAKAAGLGSVPVRVLELDDAQALEFQVIENLQREDVHPLDEALGYQALLKAGKYEIAGIAAKVNKSESYVYQRLKLTALIPEAQKAFFDGEITAGHAILIARLQPKDQQEALKEVGRDNLSVRALAGWIDDQIHLRLSRAAWSLDDEALLPSAGSCVKCPKRSGANPQLFPDVKAKDTCTDPSCFRAKLEAQVARNTEQGLVSISTAYAEYGRKKLAGVLYNGDYNALRGRDECKSAKDAVVVEADSYDRAKVGGKLTVCVNKKCKAHAGYGFGSSRGTSSVTPAEKARQRKERAIATARTLAIGAIATKVRWPLDERSVREIAAAALDRTTFEGQKLLCKALGVWPKDGKTGGFDFRRRAAAHLDGLDKHGVAGFLAAFAAVPSWGKWGGYDDKKEAERLRVVGKRCGVDLARLEKEQIAAADAKAKKAALSAKKRKAKVHTSARKKAAA